MFFCFFNTIPGFFEGTVCVLGDLMILLLGFCMWTFGDVVSLLRISMAFTFFWWGVFPGFPPAYAGFRAVCFILTLCLRAFWRDGVVFCKRAFARPINLTHPRRTGKKGLGPSFFSSQHDF